MTDKKIQASLLNTHFRSRNFIQQDDDHLRLHKSTFNSSVSSYEYTDTEYLGSTGLPLESSPEDKIERL